MKAGKCAVVKVVVPLPSPCIILLLTSLFVLSSVMSFSRTDSQAVCAQLPYLFGSRSDVSVLSPKLSPTLQGIQSLLWCAFTHSHTYWCVTSCVMQRCVTYPSTVFFSSSSSRHSPKLWHSAPSLEFPPFVVLLQSPAPYLSITPPSLLRLSLSTWHSSPFPRIFHFFFNWPCIFFFLLASHPLLFLSLLLSL